MLDAIAKGLIAAEAAQLAGMSRRSVFDWKAADRSFAAYDAAYEAGPDRSRPWPAPRCGRQRPAADLHVEVARARSDKRMVEVRVGGGDAPVQVEHQLGGDDPNPAVFILPDNHRHEAARDEEPPVIEGEADASEAETAA